jgi:cob(I)alamin adenosyltransferase
MTEQTSDPTRALNSIAYAIDNAFSCSGLDEAATDQPNIVDALQNISEQLFNLGLRGAGTGGAIEAQGKAVQDGAEAIANAINNLANAVKHFGQYP